MKPIFLVLTIASLPLCLWAKDKQIVPGKPCDVVISLLEPSPKERIEFWGKIVEIKDRDSSPWGQEIVFEPKTTREGPKLKRAKIFMKKAMCWMHLKQDQYLNVKVNERGEGTLYALAYEGVANKPLKEYPNFEPEVNACEGFDPKRGLTSADLYALATVVKIERDAKENVEIITFKPKRVWNGASLSTFKVIERIDDSCSGNFIVSQDFDLILNSADEQYYYHDCCGVLGPVASDYESRFAKSTMALKKKLMEK